MSKIKEMPEIEDVTSNFNLEEPQDKNQDHS